MRISFRIVWLINKLLVVFIFSLLLLCEDAGDMVLMTFCGNGVAFDSYGILLWLSGSGRILYISHGALLFLSSDSTF